MKKFFKASIVIGVLLVVSFFVVKKVSSASNDPVTDAINSELKEAVTELSSVATADNNIYVSDASSLQGKLEINKNSWTKNLDFSGVSNWNNVRGNRGAGTLVAPDVIVLASHHQLEKNTNLAFTAKDGTVEYRKITNLRYIPQSDIEVALLDSPLPSKFKVYPVFDYKDFMSKVGIDRWEHVGQEITPEDKKNLQVLFSNNNLRYLLLDQNRVVLTGELTTSYPQVINEMKIWAGIPLRYLKTDGNELQYNPNDLNSVRTGDSGSPSFVLYRGELVLVSTHTGSLLSVSGPFYSYYIDDVNKAISDMGSDSELRVIEFRESRGDSHEPVFSDSSRGVRISVNEHTPRGTVVGNVKAQDPDGDKITYSVLKGLEYGLNINRNTGDIYVEDDLKLDFEAPEVRRRLGMNEVAPMEYFLEIKATDESGESAYLTAWDNNSPVKVVIENVEESSLPSSKDKEVSFSNFDIKTITADNKEKITINFTEWDYTRLAYLYIVKYDKQGKVTNWRQVRMLDVTEKTGKKEFEISISSEAVGFLGEGDYFKLLVVDQQGASSAYLSNIMQKGSSTGPVFSLTKGYFKLRANSTLPNPENRGPGSPGASVDLPCGYTWSKFLNTGSVGLDVYNLQKFLIAKGHLAKQDGIPSNYFGAYTKGAVATYQIQNGLTPAEGYVGPGTRTALNKDLLSMCGNDAEVVSIPVPEIALPTVAPVIATLPATLKITSPESGSVVQSGSQIRISWTSENFAGNSTKVSVYRVGSPDVLLGSHISTSPKGYLYWTPEKSLAGSYRIKVVSEDNPAVSATSGVFTFVAESEIPKSTVITITAPKVGSTWYIGDPATITWTAGDLSDWGQNGKLELLGNEKTYVVTRKLGQTSTISGISGKYIYGTVGITEKTASNDETVAEGEYTVRICSPLGVCASKGRVNIVSKVQIQNNPYVKVTNISDANVGETKRITWTSNTAVKNVTVSLLSSDKRSYGEFLAQNIPNTGYYDWKVTDPGTTQSDFLISVRGGNNLNSAEASYTDYTDNVFKINGRSVTEVNSDVSESGQTTIESHSPAPVTVLSPGSGEVLTEGQTYTIKYESDGADNVDIRLAGPTGTKDIAYSQPNTGSYTWTVSRMGDTTSTGNSFTIAIRSHNEYGSSYAIGGYFTINKVGSGTSQSGGSLKATIISVFKSLFGGK